jgi:hypothetical protein
MIPLLISLALNVCRVAFAGTRIELSLRLQLEALVVYLHIDVCVNAIRICLDLI